MSVVAAGLDNWTAVDTWAAAAAASRKVQMDFAAAVAVGKLPYQIRMDLRTLVNDPLQFVVRVQERLASSAPPATLSPDLQTQKIRPRVSEQVLEPVHQLWILTMVLPAVQLQLSEAEEE